MDWQELLKTLGVFGFSAGLIAGILAYLIKRLTEQQLLKGIESFKAQLLKDSEISKIQYTILQERRAFTIRKMYQLLERFDRLARELINPIQLGSDKPESVRGNRASDAALEFFNYYREHKIYLDQETCQIIDEMEQKYSKIFLDFQFKDKIVAKTAEEDLWLRSWQALTEEIPLLRKRIEETFRKILGIN